MYQQFHTTTIPCVCKFPIDASRVEVDCVMITSIVNELLTSSQNDGLDVPPIEVINTSTGTPGGPDYVKGNYLLYSRGEYYSACQTLCAMGLHIGVHMTYINGDESMFQRLSKCNRIIPMLLPPLQPLSFLAPRIPPIPSFVPPIPSGLPSIFPHLIEEKEDRDPDLIETLTKFCGTLGTKKVSQRPQINIIRLLEEFEIKHSQLNSVQLLNQLEKLNNICKLHYQKPLGHKHIWPPLAEFNQRKCEAINVYLGIIKHDRYKDALNLLDP